MLNFTFKTFYCAIILLMGYVVLTVSDVKSLERILFQRDTKKISKGVFTSPLNIYDRHLLAAKSR